MGSKKSTKKIIIAIDGYSSCGKSTLAKALAKHLGYIFIDSGAMYRAVTLCFIRQNIDLSHAAEVEQALQNLTISFEYNAESEKSETYLNGENVEKEIRTMYVSNNVSEVSALKAVRLAMVKQQQTMGKRKGIVMDGRDIGTVVFPDAELKIFLTADPQIRTHRRYLELIEKGTPEDLETVAENLTHRDYIDSHRKESPLRKAPNAIEIDNTNLSQDQQMQTVMALINKLSEH